MTDPTAQIISDILKSYPSLFILLFLIIRVGGFASEKLYPDLKAFFQEALQWHRAQLALYMERDRAVLVEEAKQRVLVASKYQPVPNGQPPAPG